VWVIGFPLAFKHFAHAVQVMSNPQFCEQLACFGIKIPIKISGLQLYKL